MVEIHYAFDFEHLKAGKLGISAVYGSFLAEAASYCLYVKKHSNPVLLSLTGDVSNSGTLNWSEMNQQHTRTWADSQEATEYGAYGIAVVVAVQLTGIPYVERSAKSTGIDYWLVEKSDEHGLFQRAARLEVSGILDGEENEIRARLKTKLAQTERSEESLLPAYAAIVEFGSPETRLVRRKGAEENQ